MGMDLIGMNPKNKEGEYLYFSISRWAPLAALCCVIAPAESARCKHWEFNDGDGLDGRQSELLAQKLEEALADGSIDDCLADPEQDSDYRWVKQYVPLFIHFLRTCGGFRLW